MNTKAKTCILLVLGGLALATAPGQAQINGPLSIIWQATYGPGMRGGLGSALPYDLVQTPDGGFLIAGAVGGPANGTRTEPICGSGDYWVIKIDANGQRQWDKSYGGDITWAPGDTALRIFLTEEGFLVAGFSASQPGCLRTAPLLGGHQDFWVVRCDASGNALWDRGYLADGHSWATPNDFEATADGGYLGCGVGHPNWDEGSVYGAIIKFDGQGQQLWSKSFGCPNTMNFLLRIRETADGGFVVAGHSNATPCADKTSPYFGGYDPSNPYLGSDIWVVRFDARQNRLWDMSYGGQSSEWALDIHPLADGGFMVFGASQSNPVTDPKKGTKTSPRYGLLDFWIVRIDAQGNQLWDRSYGGTADDICSHAEPMPDGGWLLSGTSASIPSGNKTSPKFGSSDIWIVRIDDQGNKLWEQSFGGSGIEGKVWRPLAPPIFMRENISHTADGGFLLTGYSASPVSGTKTAPLISQGDYWVLKLGPEPPSLQGKMTAEGQCQICLIAPPAFQHTIQGSADFTGWKDLVTLDNPTGKVFWTDPDQPAHRFYRAVRK